MRIQLAVEVFKRVLIWTTVFSFQKAQEPTKEEPEKEEEEVDVTSVHVGFREP